MDWDRARHLLRWTQTRVDDTRGDSSAPRANASRASSLRTERRARSLCVASGKGGTGKSVVSASLATLLARRGRTLLVDADLGVGNAHILQNLCPKHTLVDVVEERLGVREVCVSCGPELDLLPGGSGVSHMAGLSPYEMHVLAVGLESIEHEYERVVVDSAAGISQQTIAIAAASDVVLVVTTPDVTALTDAYAFLKVLLQRRGDVAPLFVVNRAASEDEALRVAERLRNVSRKFLGREPRFAGWLPDDRTVVECVNARTPVVTRAAEGPFGKAVLRLAEELELELARVGARGLGRTLLRTVGYSPRQAGDAR